MTATMRPDLMSDFDVAIPTSALDKAYVGLRDASGRPSVIVHRGNDERHPLEHHVRHSPDGFEWGYAGSGPADLALAILWDHLGYEPAPSLYIEFKQDVVASLSKPGFALPSPWIASWLGRHLRGTNG